MKLKIRRNPDPTFAAVPAIIYGCIESLVPLDPTPLPISDCQADDGTLIVVSLNVRDTGKLKIEETFGVFEDFEKVEAKVEVVASPAGAVATITKGKAKLDD